MKYIRIIIKILGIAMLLFLCKHLLQAFIEFTTLIPVKPRAYIWGEFERAKYVFIWQFVFSFWVYFFAVILFYFILQINFLKKLKFFNLWLISSLSIFLFLLYVHKNQFPYKKLLSIKNPKRLNFEIYEELIIYSVIGFLLIFLIRKFLLQKSS